MSRTAHHARAARAADYVLFPRAIVVDTREQLPFSFGGLRADVSYGAGNSATLIIELVTGTLAAGDYSLWGFTDQVAIERKSIADLFGTLSQGRDRFVRELERMQDTLQFAAVVVEADWSEILNRPPLYSELPPKIVHRSVLAWQQRYPRVHWWMMPDRRLAEVTTFRILERFWRDTEKKKGSSNAESTS